MLISNLVGDILDVRHTAMEFFQTIHPWMPLISKKRFYDHHLKHSLHSQADLTLLFLCIKLITKIPPSDPRSPLYNAAKHFFLEVETSGICNIQVLQAGVLISLYEIGHSLYPAAFLSVGACARFAYTLGINGSGPVHASRVTTLVELEERRRVWWAIVILDRLENPFLKSFFERHRLTFCCSFVNIGCTGRPLATEDPQLHDRLPTNDAAWDQGVRLKMCLASPCFLLTTSLDYIFLGFVYPGLATK
jgi:hypothetical protein